MRTKVSLFIVVVLLLIAAVPFVSAQQSVDWWTLVDISVFNGVCVFDGGVSAAPVNFAVTSQVAGTEVSVPAFGLSLTSTVGVMEFMVTPPVPDGGTFDVFVNSAVAFSIMQVIDCAPASVLPVHEGPGDSFVCEVPMPSGFGTPLYAQMMLDEPVPWNGYLAVVDSQLQLFSHPGAGQGGPWLVTAGDWNQTFVVELVGPKTCQVVGQ